MAEKILNKKVKEAKEIFKMLQEKYPKEFEDELIAVATCYDRFCDVPQILHKYISISPAALWIDVAFKFPEGKEQKNKITSFLRNKGFIYHQFSNEDWGAYVYLRTK